MNYDQIRDKILKGDYVSKLSYPSKSTSVDEHSRSMYLDDIRTYREDQNRLYGEFKADCWFCIEYELGKKLAVNQFDAIFNKAWSDGHSSGYLEIFYKLRELFDVIREFV